MTAFQRWVRRHEVGVAVASFLFFLSLGVAMIYIDYANGINEFNHWIW